MKPRSWIRRASMVCLIWAGELLLLFVVAEIAAIFFLPPGNRFYYPQKLEAPSTRRIFTHQPNQRAYTIDQPFVTNSLGFRDEREVPAEKGDELRILSLGDSMAEGLGVAADVTYAKRLEGRLQTRSAPVRVINAGMGGYATWQEVDLLDELGVRVQPDVVFLEFYWNDLYVKPTRIQPLSADKSGHAPERALWVQRLAKRSRVLSFLRERAEAAWYSRYPSIEWKLQQEIYDGRTDEYLDRAYRDVASALAQFKTLSETHHFAPVVIILPMTNQVLTPQAPRAMQQRVNAIAEQLGLPTFDPLDAMRREAATGQDLFLQWDHSHFNARGHELIAGLLEQYLLDNHLLDR